jgi:hypothetical protein
MPLDALRNPSHSSFGELPSGVRQPKPLMTMRAIGRRRLELNGISKSYNARKMKACLQLKDGCVSVDT